MFLRAVLGVFLMAIMSAGSALAAPRDGADVSVIEPPPSSLAAYPTRIGKDALILIAVMISG